MNKVDLHIANLKCNGCAATVRKGLLSLEGVADAHVDLENDRVEYQYSGSDPSALVVEKLASMGYPLKSEANDFLMKAKSFVSCAKGRLDTDN